jgi:hypothetical protein
VIAVDLDADRALKARHRAIWASGDYPAVATELIPTLGPELVRACGVGTGQRVLDVAAGAGNAAIPAAEAGAEVTASDLTPELFDPGRRAAQARGWSSIGWRPTPRRCRSRPAATTSCSPASERCSRRIIGRRPTSSSGSAGRPGRSGWSDDRGVCIQRGGP